MSDLMLTPREWEVFFRLLERITEFNSPLEERVEAVQTAAALSGESSIMALEEFTSWDFEL